MRTLYLVAVLWGLSLSACFEADQRITPHQRQVFSVPYSLYQYQCYIGLAEPKIVSTNDYRTWHLGFESQANGWRLMLNGARFMYAANTHQTRWEAITSAEGLDMRIDASSGHPDSTAIGTWWQRQDGDTVSAKEVYVLDLGTDEFGQRFGYRKLQIESVDALGYRIRVAQLDGGNEQQLFIPKQRAKNWTLVSLDPLQTSTTQQPDSTDWDLCLTKYTSTLYDNQGTAYSYLLRGVLLNPRTVSVACDTLVPFEQIRLSDLERYTFSTQADAIGYDWKRYDGQTYTIDPKRSYVLRSHQGVYYKLRFSSFYSADGTPGYISFELVNLH